MTATLPEPEIAAPAELMRWTREQFEEAVAKGAFDDNPRIELLDGYILTMPVQSERHYRSVHKTSVLLSRVFGSGYYVRLQAPLALDHISDPEPDVAVVPGSPDDKPAERPSTAVLLVEVSDSTLAKDRGRKLRAYARNGIADYWIVNLLDGQLEVYREPDGETYRARSIYRAGDRVAPLARPDAPIAVGELMP